MAAPSAGLQLHSPISLPRSQGGFTRMLALTGQHLPDTQPERRELMRRVIALDPTIDCDR